mmetsp:Transcript_43087/g.109033  ORF Transcript_43087/g.109033 Transcript_43087/m.109033 type:complete len:247 (-) Transcript_43087:361-1101(-)
MRPGLMHPMGQGSSGRLVKQVKVHVLLLLFLGLRLGRGSCSTATATCRGRGGSKGLRVGEVVLDLLGEREGVVDLQGDGQHVLVAVDDGVRNGGEGGVANGQAHRGQVAHAGSKLVGEVLLSDVEHLGRVDRAVLKDLHDDQAIREGLDAELGEQGGLRGAHALALCDDRHIAGDLDGTLGNLGGDVERLEEGRLLGAQASAARRDVHGQRRQQAHTRRRALLELADLVAGLDEVAVGEDQADVAH